MAGLSDSIELAPGRSVTFEVIGQGEPLLWIEGGPGFPACLGRADVDLLRDSFTCYLVDAPGCGGSAAPESQSDYDHFGHVRFFDEVRVALGLGAVTVMGHSWGGLIALTYAAERPESVRRCIVVDGYAGDGSVAPEVFLEEQERALDRLKTYDWYEKAVAAWESLEAVGDRTSAQWEEAFQPCWPLYFAYPESSTARKHIARLRQDCHVNVEVMRVWEQPPLSELDLCSLLSKISCPSLILVGEHDFICGQAWAEAVAGSISGAHLVICRDCGHIPQYEDPEGFTEIVTRWCQSHRPDRPGQS